MKNILKQITNINDVPYNGHWVVLQGNTGKYLGNASKTEGEQGKFFVFPDSVTAEYFVREYTDNPNCHDYKERMIDTGHDYKFFIILASKRGLFADDFIRVGNKDYNLKETHLVSIENKPTMIKVISIDHINFEEKFYTRIKFSNSAIAWFNNWLEIKDIQYVPNHSRPTDEKQKSLENEFNQIF